MLQRDLILRLVQDMARLLARALGLRKQGLTELAVQEVEAGSASLFGLDLGVVAAVDAGNVARQLVEPARIAALARLVAVRGHLADDAGDPAAALWRRRAVELWLEAAAAGETLDEEALRAVAVHPMEDLGPRQRRLREAIG
jgi:hypothetical protein